MLSKTKQIQRFRELLNGKSFREICQLRLDHETINYDNNGKRTKARIAFNVKLPLSLTSLLLEVPLEIWGSIMEKIRYWDWIGREFDETVRESVIRRNRKNFPCGTISYEPKIEKLIETY